MPKNDSVRKAIIKYWDLSWLLNLAIVDKVLFD